MGGKDDYIRHVMNAIAQKFSITPRAVEQIARIIASEDGNVFRLAVLGGGCSGFQYQFSLDDAPHDDDVILQYRTASDDEVVAVIDSMSLDFISGGQLDFLDELAGQYFQVNNPNASAGCGCGTSFAI